MNNIELSDPARRQRNANIASVVIIGLMAVAIAFFAWYATVNSESLLFVSVALFSAVLLAWIVALLLTRRGRTEQGVMLGLAALILLVPLNSILIAGRGLGGGLAIAIGGSMIAGLTLEPARARWFIAFSILSGLASVAIDLFGSPARINAAFLSPFANVLLAIAVIAVGLVLLLEFRNFSVRTKLVIAFVTIAVVSVGGVTYAASQAIQSNLTTNSARDLKTRTQAAALAIGITLDRNVDRFTTLSLDNRVQDEVSLISDSYPAGEPERDELIARNISRWASADPQDSVIRNALSGQLTASLRQFGQVFQGNKELLITDQRGSVIAATDWQPTYNFSNVPWWQVAYNSGRGSIFVGQPEFDPMISEYGIRLALPIYSSRGGRVVGVVQGIYTLTALQRALLLNSFGASGKVDLLFPQGQILTSDGTFRALTPTEFNEIKEGFNQPLATLTYRGTPLLSSQGVVGVSDEQPEPYLRSSAWRTIATIQADEALGALAASSQAALVAGLVAIGLAIFLALLLAQFLTRPIRRLTVVAEQVQSGDLAARAPVETGDEIGTLAKAFNAMTARLQDTLAGLEWRVADRTRELSQANLALQSNSAYLSALSDTSSGLFERLNLNDLLQAIVERAGALLGTQHGFVFFSEPGENEIQMRVGSGLYDDLVGTRAQEGVGLAGTVWQTGQPMTIEDYQKWEGRLPGSRRDALHAIVAVPLTRGSAEGGEEVTVGVIGLAYTEEGKKFGKGEVEILQRFAQLASIALDNAKLYANSETRVKELGALNNISQLVSQPSDFQTMIDQVGDQVRKIFGADFGYFALLNPETNLIEFPYAVDEGKRTRIDPLPLGQGITSQVITNGEPILLAHASEEDYVNLGALDSGDGASPNSLLAVPIRAGESIIGVLSVQHVEQERAFTSEDQRLLATIAATVGVGIERARLFQQTQIALAETQRLAAREREAADQLQALNRRLTREGWRDYLDQLSSRIIVESAGYESSGGHAGGANADGSNGKVRVPIQLRGEVIGEIELEPEDASGTMSPEDMVLVSDVAENIGLALDNARLFSETQRRVTELDALNQISQAVTTELELGTILNLIGDQLRAIFDVQNVYVALYDAQTEMISLPYFVNDNERVPVEPIRFGEGITSHIIRMREPLVLNQNTAQALERMGAKVIGNPARSYLGVPIIVGEDVTGVISIQSIEREGMFDESNVRLLETIAATVGAAIQNAQLYGAMQEEVVVRQRAEEEIKLSLREKEVLLKEIHHRVKNNLQIITSLLNLQSAQLKDPEALMLFRESQSRVRSMALIHEKLYQSKDLARVDFDSYVRDLIVFLFRSYATNPDKIRTHIETQGMFLDIDTAIPCGLIISELVTNTLKYAFPEGQRGNLYVGLGRADDGMLMLEVRDDGVGFPADFDWRKSDSLGLQLVSTLSAQLHGTVEVDGKDGASFKLSFPG